jgi:hypothetical protein
MDVTMIVTPDLFVQGNISEMLIKYFLNWCIGGFHNKLHIVLHQNVVILESPGKSRIQIEATAIRELLWIAPNNQAFPCVKMLLEYGSFVEIDFLRFRSLDLNALLIWLHNHVTTDNQKDWEKFWLRFAWFFDPIDSSWQRFTHIIWTNFIFVLFVFIFFVYYILMKHLFSMPFRDIEDSSLFLDTMNPTTGIIHFPTYFLAVLLFCLPNFFKGKYIANRFFKGFYFFPSRWSIKKTVLTWLCFFCVVIAVMCILMLLNPIFLPFVSILIKLLLTLVIYALVLIRTMRLLIYYDIVLNYHSSREALLYRYARLVLRRIALKIKFAQSRDGHVHAYSGVLSDAENTESKPE